MIQARWGRFASHAATLLSLLWLFPYAWMVISSLKSLKELMADPSALAPRDPNLDAYREVFAMIPVGRYTLTTLAIAVAIALVQIALALPAGYALAKLQFRGRKAILLMVVACLLVPTQVTFIASFFVLGKLSLVNTVGALIVPFAASALGTFLVRQALLDVPDEIIEAARLDGASELSIVYRILGPMLRPTLTSLFLVSFVYHYNDYFWPLVMTTDDSVRTLPLGIALLREQGTGVRWHVVMAANVILSAPILALFAFVQRDLVRGVVAK